MSESDEERFGRAEVEETSPGLYEVWRQKPGEERYRQVDNLFAMVGKRSDGGDAVVSLGTGPLVSDVVSEQMRSLAAKAAETYGMEVRIVRFVRAEVVEVFEP